MIKSAFYINLLIIEYLALTPQHIEIVEGFWDKQNHFMAFFVLYLLFSFAYKNLTTVEKTIILLFVGFQMEIIQYFIPGRFFSLLDIVADGVGIVIAIVLLKLKKQIIFICSN